jgi:hypothetical protein
VRAKINNIPAAEDPSWGAVLAALLRTHPHDWTYQWSVYQPHDGAAFSVIDIKGSGEDVEEVRAEIGAVVALVNDVARRDPLNTMREIDPGLVEVVVD